MQLEEVKKLCCLSSRPSCTVSGAAAYVVVVVATFSVHAAEYMCCSAQTLAFWHVGSFFQNLSEPQPLRFPELPEPLIKYLPPHIIKGLLKLWGFVVNPSQHQAPAESWASKPGAILVHAQICMEVEKCHLHSRLLSYRFLHVLTCARALGRVDVHG